MYVMCPGTCFPAWGSAQSEGLVVTAAVNGDVMCELIA